MSSRLQCRPLHFVCFLWNFSLLPCSVPQGTALSPGPPGPLFWVPHHRFPTSGSWRWLGLLLPTWMCPKPGKGPGWCLFFLHRSLSTTFHSYTLSSLTIGHLSKATSQVSALTVTKLSFRLFFHVCFFLISSPLIFLLHFHLSQFYPLKLHPVSKASNVSFSPSLKSDVISLSLSFFNLLCLFTKLHFFCRFLGASLEA